MVIRGDIVQNKILVISSYKVDLLKALVNAVVSKIASVIIIGKKNKIIEICFLHNINYHLFEIIDSDYEVDICYKANELLNKYDIKIIIFGDFSKDYQKNIAISKYEINVVDIPKLRHLLFLSTNLQEEYIGYEEKKDAIIVGKEFMQLLQIHYCAVGLVSCNPTKTTFIERNVIKMCPELNANIIDVINAKDIFNDRHNLLVFNTVDATKIFIETVTYNDDAKYASIKKASKHYVIDACNLRMRDIFFSIFLLNKLSLNSEAS